MSATRPVTREQWLIKAGKLLEGFLEGAGVKLLSPWTVSVGWPSKGATSARQRRIGECWHPAGERKDSHLFVSPVLSDPVEVLATLAHELVHVAHPTDGHKAGFTKSVRAIGLVGKPTATVAGDVFKGAVQPYLKRLGEYPHTAIKTGSSSSGPKQGTRLLKAYCIVCGYTVRVTQKWLDYGYPICPQDNIEMIDG